MERPWLKHYEPNVRAHLDYPSVPMHYFLNVRRQNIRERAATIFGGVVHQLGGRLMDAKLSYRHWTKRQNRLANALSAMGVKKGDRVALYLPTARSMSFRTMPRTSWARSWPPTPVVCPARTGISVERTRVRRTVICSVAALSDRGQGQAQHQGQECHRDQRQRVFSAVAKDAL